MRAVRLPLWALLLLGATILACNFGQSPPGPTPFRVTQPAPIATTPPATTLPTVSPTSVEIRYTTYTDEELGLTFSYPEEWALESGPDSVTIASDASLLTAERFAADEAGVLIRVAPAAQFFADEQAPAEALIDVVDQLEFSQEQEIIAGPLSTTINGQEAATATVVGHDPGETTPTLIYLTLFRDRERAALISAITLATETNGEYRAAAPFRETLEQIAASVQLSAPAGITVEGMLAYGDTVRDTLPEDESRAWTFVGEAGDRINLTAEPLEPELDITVDILDSRGTSILPAGIIDEAFGTETVERLLLPEKGEYVVLLAGFAGSGGNYALTLNQLTQTGDGEALILLPDNSIVGEVSPEEVDIYLLDEVSELAVTVLAEPDPDFDLVLEHYGPEGELFGSSDGWYEGEAEQLSVDPGGGTIQVRGYAGSAGGYTISLLAGSPDTAGSTVFISDVLDGTGAEAVFPFYAPAGELVTGYFQPDEELDLVVEAWNGDEETLLETVDFSYGVEQINFRPPAAGNYYFVLYGFEGGAGSYTATLQSTAATVFELAPGDLVVGRLPEDGVQEYALYLEVGAERLLTATGEGEMDVTLSVLDLDDNLLASADETAAGQTETLLFTAPGGGEPIFILQVASFTGEAGTFELLIE